MKHGIEGAASFLVFLSEGILDRPFCQFEIREALALRKPMQLIHESDPRFGAFDFGKAGAAAPADLKAMLDNHESLPFRRRGYERDGMLQTLIERAGFKALLGDARASATAIELAKVPDEIQHFDLETFHDRPVQTVLVELLLLPKQDTRFTSCIVMYGMGGTGKTVTVVAVVRENAVRGHFSNIYWLTIGADAVGEKIRQLQSSLHTQLTGEGASSTDLQQKDEQEWLGMLVEAMTIDRGLVVLDDPWLPEQVRFLNPIDSAQTEHRLLITTRIRGLAHSRATCIELSMMAKDEAVALLMDVAGITKHAYMSEHPDSNWPPPAAHELATECGLLPITLAITAQLVRSWGKGWEKAVLPLLQEEHSVGSGRGATTVEERIIGAGLKSLKREENGLAIIALFEMFAVTQEDFVHPMAVIELLWRSCCAPSTEAAGRSGKDVGLSARLQVRQWMQLLIDQSLLLGSSMKGVHVHDIVLTYLRKAHSPSELRALQKAVVEELVRMSKARPFEDTGCTAQAFDGEEVDWYVTNVGSFHIKQSMDPSVPMAENEDVMQWLLVDDALLSQQTALAVGEEQLEKLVVHKTTGQRWLEAAKIKMAVSFLTKGPLLVIFDQALELLEKCGTARTTAALQLELDIVGNAAYLIGNPKILSGSPEKVRVMARVAELSQNTSLRVDPWKLMYGTIFPKCIVLLGAHPLGWPAGKVNFDSVFRGMSLWVTKAVPLMQMSCDKAVGARKEWFTLRKLLYTPGATFNAVLHNTEESVSLFQSATDNQWGSNCSSIMKAISMYKFTRHFQIARSTGARFDLFCGAAIAHEVAEKTGNIEDCIAITERQQHGTEAYVHASPPPATDFCTTISSLGVFLGVEPHHMLLKPRQNVKQLLAYGGMANMEEAESCYCSSAEFAPVRAVARSSSDGLYHAFRAPAAVTCMRAVLSFALGVDTTDTSWLNDLPSADVPTLHCVGNSSIHPVTARVLVAEVLEQQARHADAIRFAQADLQSNCNFCTAAKVRSGRVLGRCHAAMGEHALSVAAFDSAIELAKSGKLLLSEALAVRGRALAGRGGGDGGVASGPHWDVQTGRQRLAEVISRMQGPQERLEAVLGV
jgi:hypothetical protein